MLPFVLLFSSLFSLPAAAAPATAPERSKEQPPSFEDASSVTYYSSDVLGFGYVYTVKAGDDLWLIALAHGISMEELAAINNIKPPYWIHPDDKLWIPAAPTEVKHKAAAVAKVPAPQAVAGSAPAAPPPAPAPLAVTPPIAADSAQSMALGMLALMNQKRIAYGLPALSWSPELAAAAQAHAEDCSQRGWGSHVGSDGARLRTRLARAGYSPAWAGENWANTSTLQGAFDMWWFEGPGGPHYENIMHPNFTQAGVGIASSAWGYYFIVDFGRP